MGKTMSITPTVIQPISNLNLTTIGTNFSIEKELYLSAVNSECPIFNGAVNAVSNGKEIKFNFKKEVNILVSLGYLEDGKVNLFASETGNLYAKIEGKKSIAVGGLERILDHLNYNDELISIISKNAPSYFKRDLSVGITEEELAKTCNNNFVKMNFEARNGLFTGWVKPCLRKYNVIVYQCLNSQLDDYSYLVIDKKNNLNLFFRNIIELENSKIGRSYKLSSSVINTKPNDMPYIPML